MKKIISASVDELVIKMGMDAANELRVSFSSFIEAAIREKIDMKKSKPGIVDQEKPSEPEILAAGQKKLDESRKNRKVKKEKIELVKSLTGFSGARPKGEK